MDFEFSDEQRALRDSTRKLLNSAAPTSATRALVDAGAAYDATLWQRGADLGWAALAVAEDLGGLGQGLPDLAVVAVEHGRVVLPSPFIPTVVVADAVARSENTELRSEVLPGLLDGTATAAWAFAETGRAWTPDGVSMTAARAGDGLRLHGRKAMVQDASTADHLLVDVLLDGAPARVLVPRATDGITVRRASVLDVTRESDDVTFDAVHVPMSRLLADGSSAATGTARGLGMMATLICAESVGVGERLLEMSVDYAKVRVQFDRPIGSFQSIKHKCATMRVWLQASTAAMYYAAMAVDAGTSDADRAASVAKSYVGESISRLAGEALQIHGGIGFTWEHDLHLYLRRAKTNELLHGDVATHRELLCRAVERGELGLAAG